MLRAVIARELQAYWLSRYEALQSLAVFAVVVVLFPLGLDPEPTQLALIAPAVLWGSALLACVFGLETLFRQELRDGWLDQALTGRWPLPLLLAIKLAVHWLYSGAPICLAAGAAGLALGLSDAAAHVAMLSLLLGTPTLVGLGSVAAALTANLTGGAMLSALLVLPLYVPVLVFGASAITLAQAGQGAQAPLYLLGCLLLMTLMLAPLASAVALRAVSE